MDEIENAIVTGGAGFIGSHIVETLVASGVSTTVIDNLATGSLDQVHHGAAFLDVDIADPAVADAIDDIKPDVIFHAAAQVSVLVSTNDPHLDRRINLEGTEHVLTGARRAGCKRFVFLSSGGAVYGEANLATESAVPDPANPYGIHKLAAEGYVRTSGLSFAIARLANVYGPRQRTDLEGGVIAIFIDRVLRSLPVTIFGSGGQVRDFVFVGDVVDATIRMAHSPTSGTWNVSTGVETTVRDLLAQVEETIAPVTSVEIRPRRAGDVDRSSLSNDKIHLELGWSPQHTLREGLTLTIDPGQAV